MRLSRFYARKRPALVCARSFPRGYAALSDTLSNGLLLMPKKKPQASGKNGRRPALPERFQHFPIQLLHLLVAPGFGGDA